MTRLMICREYPPAPAGGIGTYTVHMARLLAQAGETVHVIAQLRRGGQITETDPAGRLVIHRLRLPSAAGSVTKRFRAGGPTALDAALLHPYPPQLFSWQASLMAEHLIEHEQIDVIEAPEYEAPLYHFQLRRALGLGPRRKPPVLVHFHSPTELIVRFNEWDLGAPGHVTAKRLEDYSIAAADGWVCPSRFLACQAEAMYGLPSGSISVIPYPLGIQPSLERDSETWARGTICYVGRLEARKGVVEWIEAAVSAAHEYPDARFEFVGRNILDGRWAAGDQVVARLVPARVRHQFAFLGERPRHTLSRHLARARIAVVPSRWDNFPNACVEAMAAGLPVVASQEGGMVEMLRDGATGWLARPDPIGLAEALRRALATPVATLAAMGRQAAADIRSLCDNERIVARHLELHRALGAAGPRRSVAVPEMLPRMRPSPSGVSPRRAPLTESGQGIAVAVISSTTHPEIGECLRALALQSRRPEMVVLIGPEAAHAGADAIDQMRAQGWRIAHRVDRDPWSARARAIETLVQEGSRPLGIVFLDADDRLQAEFVATTERVLERCPSVGVVSCWTRSQVGERVRVRPCPAFPYQWLWNDAAACSVLRLDALTGIAELGPVVSRTQADWLMATAVMAAGWAAVTVPEVLASLRPEETVGLPPAASTTRRMLLDRFAGVAARDAGELALLAGSPGAVWLGKEELSARDYAEMAWETRGRYGRVARWVLAKVRVELAQRWSGALNAWRGPRRDGGKSGR